MMRPVDLIGIGMTPFGKHPDKSAVELAGLAARAALQDAGLIPAAIEAGFCANVMAGRLFGDIAVGQDMLWQVGLNRVPVFNLENACTSGSTALHLAHMAVAAGIYDTAIVVGAEKMFVPSMGLLSPGESDLDTLEGMVVPAGFALRAVRYMAQYGATPEQLALVAVKNRRHASANPLAQFRQPVTVDEVLAAPMIADPLTRLSCCPNADGAAAVVLCAAERSRRHTSRPIRLAASVLVTGTYENPVDLIPFEIDIRGCTAAYEQAGLGPEDLSAAECHDAFTIAELLHYEAMGLCPVGEGAALVASGATSLGGKTPVNTSGGLLGKGHPLGATGVAQVIEGVLQLRGQAGPRQVENARVFMAECMGGGKNGDSKSCTVNILTT